VALVGPVGLPHKRTISVNKFHKVPKKISKHAINELTSGMVFEKDEERFAISVITSSIN